MTESERKMALEWYATYDPEADKNANDPTALNNNGWKKVRDKAVETFAAGLAAGREWSANLLTAEAKIYLDSAKKCDDSGNTFGGTIEHASASCLNRIAAAIRKGPQ